MKSSSVTGKELNAEMSQVGPILPYSSIQIYAEFSQYKYALKALVETRESDRPLLLYKV